MACEQLINSYEWRPIARNKLCARQSQLAQQPLPALRTRQSSLLLASSRPHSLSSSSIRRAARSAETTTAAVLFHRRVISEDQCIECVLNRSSIACRLCFRRHRSQITATYIDVTNLPCRVQGTARTIHRRAPPSRSRKKRTARETPSSSQRDPDRSNPETSRRMAVASKSPASRNAH